MLVFLKAGVSEGNIAYLFLKVWIFFKGLHLCWSVFQAVLTSFKYTILKVNIYNKKTHQTSLRLKIALLANPPEMISLLIDRQMPVGQGTSPKRLWNTEVPNFGNLQMSWISLSLGPIHPGQESTELFCCKAHQQQASFTVTASVYRSSWKPYTF